MHGFIAPGLWIGLSNKQSGIADPAYSWLKRKTLRVSSNHFVAERITIFPVKVHCRAAAPNQYLIAKISFSLPMPGGHNHETRYAIAEPATNAARSDQSDILVLPGQQSGIGFAVFSALVLLTGVVSAICNVH
ncbi:MAG: hypothetical protein KDJ38_16325 [Gammaproteobacteria bacterium]|nr:hypothetical protein [Gammaproteobacteria bacterium]